MAIQKSFWLRVAAVILVSLLCSIYHSAIETTAPSARLINSQRKTTIKSCNLVMATRNLRLVQLPSFAVRCMSELNKYMTMEIRAGASSFGSSAFSVQIIEQKPMMIVFALSLSLITFFFVFLLILRIEGDSSQYNESGKTIFHRIISMLPKHISNLLFSLDIVKTIMNALFLDAGLFIIVAVSYHAIPQFLRALPS